MFEAAQSIAASVVGWLGPNGPPRLAALLADNLGGNGHARASSRTQQVHLGALERFYVSAETQLGTDRLDSVLAAGDFNALENVLAGFLGKLRNDGLISGADRSGPWTNSTEIRR